MKKILLFSILLFIPFLNFSQSNCSYTVNEGSYVNDSYEVDYGYYVDDYMYYAQVNVVILTHGLVVLIMVTIIVVDSV